MQACMWLNSSFGEFQYDCNIAELVCRNNHLFYMECLKIFSKIRGTLHWWFPIHVVLYIIWVIDGEARKFFVTSVKDLSTGVKYMDSKVDFWFYSYRCQGYGFQSGFLVLFVPVSRIWVPVSSIWIPKWRFGFIRTGGGGGDKGGKMCRSTMRRNLYKLTKIFNDVLSEYLKNGLGDLHETLWLLRPS